ncbi:reverse transcriptase domain-containing protein [Tanacetum coccineum]
MSDFQWTPETERAFQSMKKCIAKLPMVTAPKPKEELIMYLCAAREAVSAVFLTERDSRQVPVYFVSRALQTPKINYNSIEKLVLALVHATRRLRRYFQAHLVHSTSPVGQGHQSAIADFIAERPDEEGLSMEVQAEEPIPRTMEPIHRRVIMLRGAAKRKQKSKRVKQNRIHKLCPSHQTSVSRNTEKKINRGKGNPWSNGRGRTQLDDNAKSHSWKPCCGALPDQAEYVVKEIHEGSCSMHSGPRSVVAKAIRSGYYWPTMHRDAHNIIRKCDDCPFPEAQGRVKFLIIAIDYFTKWIEANPVATIMGSQVKKFVWDNIVCRFGIPGEIISDNRKQFRDNLTTPELDILEERIEKAAVREARNKAKMERYYNAKVRSTSFRPGDFVYRSNEASHAKESGKLGPKWEGPYEVVEALGKGAYKLRNGSGDVLPRTWNVQDLKKCYL